MEPKVAQKIIRENHYSNINHVSTMFKEKMMLSTEVYNCYGTTNFFNH